MASASRSRNTILLVQYNLTIGSRTFMEFETLAAAMDEICALFERELKALNPSQSNMTYDIADLYAYIDQLCDISCLVYHQPIQAYFPRNKDWIKKQLYLHLRASTTES